LLKFHLFLIIISLLPNEGPYFLDQFIAKT